jgi:hypothetical protein
MAKHENNQQQKRTGGTAEIEGDRVSAVADWEREDRTRVEKEHGMGYRHIQSKNVNKRKRQGWIVDTTQESDLDDMVLMKIPIEKSDAYYAAKQKQARLNEAGVDDPARLGPTGFTRK